MDRLIISDENETFILQLKNWILWKLIPFLASPLLSALFLLFNSCFICEFEELLVWTFMWTVTSFSSIMLWQKELMQKDKNKIITQQVPWRHVLQPMFPQMILLACKRKVKEKSPQSAKINRLKKNYKLLTVIVIIFICLPIKKHLGVL